MATVSASSIKAPVLRKFGRYELRQLLGRSAATMAWLAVDTAAAHEVMLVLPREQPVGAGALEAWLEGVKKAARLNHPNLAPVLEATVRDQWPYVAVDRAHGLTLGEWLRAHPGSTPGDMVDAMIQALQGLAYAHDAGMGHHDVQMHSLLIDDQGNARWMALGAAGALTPVRTASAKAPEGSPRAAADLGQVQRQRRQAELDLLGCGLLMHQWLTSQPALDEADYGAAIGRLAPWGYEILRLPFNTAHPVPDALRAIVNRSTAHQERQRYRSARTLLRALEGFRQAQAVDSGGPLALLMDRMNRVGHLPAQPGLAVMVAAITSVEGQHAEEIAAQVLRDVALSLELLRASNSMQVRGSLLSGDGPILAVRRSIALLGVDGVRRAANALRLWPGPLQPHQSAALRRLIDRVRLAGYAAQALRPAGYDPEVIFLVVVLQNLGQLLARYHFPEEADQIEQLMQPSEGPVSASGEVTQLPGLSEAAAANAVLGVDFDALRSAVVRHWGLGEEVVNMTRPVPADKSVRMPDSDAEILRATASAAIELAAAAELRTPQLGTVALTHIASRYSRLLKVSVADLRETLLSAAAAVRDGGEVAQTSRTGETGETGEQADAAASAGAAR
jgi:eukaryotic-like serine/threonine-protein kinase